MNFHLAQKMSKHFRDRYIMFLNIRHFRDIKNTGQIFFSPEKLHFFQKLCFQQPLRCYIKRPHNFKIFETHLLDPYKMFLEVCHTR